jgi:hypothetical protein
VLIVFAENIVVKVVAEFFIFGSQGVFEIKTRDGVDAGKFLAAIFAGPMSGVVA